MVNEPVDHCGGNNVVGEDLAPPPERHVRGEGASMRPALRARLRAAISTPPPENRLVTPHAAFEALYSSSRPSRSAPQCPRPAHCVAADRPLAADCCRDHGRATPDEDELPADRPPPAATGSSRLQRYSPLVRSVSSRRAAYLLALYASHPIEAICSRTR